MDYRKIILIFLTISILFLVLVYKSPRNAALPDFSQNNSSTYGQETGKRRRKRLDWACATFPGRFRTKLRSKWKPTLYFSDKYEFLVCGVPKCGSTQWRKLILLLDGVIDAYSVDDFTGVNSWLKAWHKKMLWNAFDTKKVDGKREARTRINNYFKIMTVREPLQRIVSAYKNKLEGRWDRHFVSISKSIHRKYGNGSNGLATFSEFVDMILETRDSKNLNRHWRPYTDLCSPCAVEYDYVLKLETIGNDIAYVARELGIERDRVFKDSADEILQRKWKMEYPKYYQQLTPGKRKEIFEYYKLQYDVFGYPYPKFTDFT